MPSRDTRQRILDAAEHLMTTGGYARLTTKEIAKAAGCAEGTLFNHFRRKEDLCLAVVLENAPSFRNALLGIQAGEATVEQNLVWIATSAIKFFDKLIPLSISLFADTELLLKHRQSMHESERGPADVFVLVTNYLGEEQQLGRIPLDVSPKGIAAALHGPCFHRVYIRQVSGRDLFPQTDENVASEIVKTLIRGLDPKP